MNEDKVCCGCGIKSLDPGKKFGDASRLQIYSISVRLSKETRVKFGDQHILFKCIGIAASQLQCFIQG